MESFLRKYAWAINFGLIGTGALLTALLMNGFVATQLAQFTVPEMPRYHDGDGAGDRSDSSVIDRGSWVDALRGRCLFGCPEEVDPNICPDGCPDGEYCEAGECVPDMQEDEDFTDSDVPMATELDMKLTGAMVATNPRWSMAMILDNRENKTHVLGVGGLLSEEPLIEILEIRRDRVFIDNNGQLEFIRMEDAHEGDPSRTRGSSTEARSREASAREVRPIRGEAEREAERKRRAAEAEKESGVSQQGENHYRIDRAAVERQLEDPAALTRQARIMPNYRDGEPNGLRLVGVTPNSFYSQLGIRSGDVIHSVNGNAITNQRQALEMLERMGQGGDVKIEVERRGRTQEMTYEIR